MPVLKNGNIIPLSLTSGFSPLQQALTNSTGTGTLGAPVPLTGISPETAAIGASGIQAVKPQINYLPYILGFVVLLVVLKIAVEHEKSGMDVSFVHVGVYNWVAVGLMAALFIIIIKTILNKYYVTGLTDIFNVA